MAQKEGVPILVEIGLKSLPNGEVRHAFPDWQLLPLAKTGKVTDHQIVKWRYDNSCGHDDESPDSPRGTWLGMMIVTEQFADEAVAMFGDVVTVMAEAEAQAFWETKAHGHIPTNRTDVAAMQGLKAEHDLQVILANTEAVAEVKTRIAKALDPDDPEPGLKKTPDKTWADAKKVRNFTIKKAAVEL